MDHFEKYLHDFTERLRILKYSKQSIKNYAYHLNQFFSWLASQSVTDPRDVTEKLLTCYQSMLSASYNLNTIHLKLRSLKRFFSFLEETSRLLYNPAEKLTYPKLGNRLPKNILTVDEMKRLLAAPNIATSLGLRDRAILELLYSTGLRLNECTKLSIHDADYKGGYLRVNFGKGTKQRVMPLGKKACDYLKRYLLIVRPKLTRNFPDVSALFVMRQGTSRGLSAPALQVLIRKYGRQAKIKKQVSAHAIRRTFATHLLRNNAHPLYIQRLLGHATSETLKKYIKVTGTEVKATHKKTHPREKDKR